MKYRPTILNLASGVLIAGTIICTIFSYDQLSSGEGWGVVAMLGLIGIGFAGIILDFFVQLFTSRLSKRSRNLSRNLFGILTILGLYYYSQYQDRSIIINVPEGYNGTVALVWDVPGQPRIKRNIFTLNAELDLPSNGIILTSSDFGDNDIATTDFRFPSGKILNISGNGKNLYSDLLTYQCKGQVVKYRISNLMGPEGEEQIKKKIRDVQEELNKNCAQ